jgi:hypothetical protein
MSVRPLSGLQTWRPAVCRALLCTNLLSGRLSDVSNETKKMSSDVPPCRLPRSCPLARLFSRPCARSGFTPAAVKHAHNHRQPLAFAHRTPMIAHSCAHPNELLTLPHSPPVLPPLLFSSSSHSSLTSRSESLWDVASLAMFTSRGRRTQSSSWPSRFRSNPVVPSHSRHTHAWLSCITSHAIIPSLASVRFASAHLPCAVVSAVLLPTTTFAHTRGRCPPAQIASITHICH